MPIPVYNYPSAEVADFYTKVQNVSASRMFFGFLPPHGRWLDSWETLSFWGSIGSWLTRLTPNQRARRSFEVAVAGTATVDPVLAVVTTPAVHLQDVTTEDVKVLAWDSSGENPVTVVDPSWGNYYSSEA